jgi:hypothetical protein
MAQNEKNRTASLTQDDIQNQDQTSQRRQTDDQNLRAGRSNTVNNDNMNDTNDRGISSISSNAYRNDQQRNADKKNSVNKQNTPR